MKFKKNVVFLRIRVTSCDIIMSFNVNHFLGRRFRQINRRFFCFLTIVLSYVLTTRGYAPPTEIVSQQHAK